VERGLAIDLGARAVADSGARAAEPIAAQAPGRAAAGARARPTPPRAADHFLVVARWQHLE
jgi:hypothetical protein